MKVDKAQVHIRFIVGATYVQQKLGLDVPDLSDYVLPVLFQVSVLNLIPSRDLGSLVFYYLLVLCHSFYPQRVAAVFEI